MTEYDFPQTNEVVSIIEDDIERSNINACVEVWDTPNWMEGPADRIAVKTFCASGDGEIPSIYTSVGSYTGGGIGDVIETLHLLLFGTEKQNQILDKITYTAEDALSGDSPGHITSTVESISEHPGEIPIGALDMSHRDGRNETVAHEIASTIDDILDDTGVNADVGVYDADEYDTVVHSGSAMVRLTTYVDSFDDGHRYGFEIPVEHSDFQGNPQNKALRMYRGLEESILDDATFGENPR